MKIQIISLKNNKERRDKCLKLKEKNPNIDLFDAIDKKNPELIKEMCKKHNVNMGCHGATGCALSHIILLKKFIESEEKYMIILEDDCIILQKLPNNDKDIEKILKNINTNHENTDILYLTGRITSNNKYEVTSAIGTYGYIVTKHGAKKIIEVSYGTTIPIDWVIEAHCVYGRDIIRNKATYITTDIKIRAYKSKIQYISHNDKLKSNIS